MLGRGFSCPTTSPVASAVASSDTSTGVATAPMPVIIDDQSLIGTPRYFLPCMSLGESTFSFEVSSRMLRIAIHEWRVEHRRRRYDLTQRPEVVMAHRDGTRLYAIDHLADTAKLR